jgi:hypothetical protein
MLRQFTDFYCGKVPKHDAPLSVSMAARRKHRMTKTNEDHCAGRQRMDAGELAPWVVEFRRPSGTCDDGEPVRIGGGLCHALSGAGTSEETGAWASPHRFRAKAKADRHPI